MWCILRTCKNCKTQKTNKIQKKKLWCTIIIIICEFAYYTTEVTKITWKIKMDCTKTYILKKIWTQHKWSKSSVATVWRYFLNWHMKHSADTLALFIMRLIWQKMWRSIIWNPDTLILYGGKNSVLPCGKVNHYWFELSVVWKVEGFIWNLDSTVVTHLN